MWRAALACLALLAFAAPAQAQSSHDFVGVWYDVPIDRAPARRLTLSRIEIARVPTLRVPARYSVHVWVRCIDDPSRVCDLGTAGGEERALSGGTGAGIFAEFNDPRVSIPRGCRITLWIVPGTDPRDPDHPENHKGLDYRLTAPAAHCGGPYAGLAQTLGRLSNIAPPVFRPIEPVAPPRLPRQP